MAARRIRGRTSTPPQAGNQTSASGRSPVRSPGSGRANNAPLRVPPREAQTSKGSPLPHSTTHHNGKPRVPCTETCDEAETHIPEARTDRRISRCITVIPPTNDSGLLREHEEGLCQCTHVHRTQCSHPTGELQPAGAGVRSPVRSPCTGNRVVPRGDQLPVERFIRFHKECVDLPPVLFGDTPGGGARVPHNHRRRPQSPVLERRFG